MCRKSSHHFLGKCGSRTEGKSPCVPRNLHIVITQPNFYRSKNCSSRILCNNSSFIRKRGVLGKSFVERNWVIQGT